MLWCAVSFKCLDVLIPEGMEGKLRHAVWDGYRGNRGTLAAHAHVLICFFIYSVLAPFSAPVKNTQATTDAYGILPAVFDSELS